jgi:hypothetical protein
MTRAPLIAAVLALSAAAPPPDSDDATELRPYASWIEAQTNAVVGSCCSTADGRIVDWRIVEEHYEVRFRQPDSIEGQPRPEPGHWYPVPAAAVLRGSNPTGYAVAWWFARGIDGPVRCFAPVDLY